MLINVYTAGPKRALFIATKACSLDFLLFKEAAFFVSLSMNLVGPAQGFFQIKGDAFPAAVACTVLARESGSGLSFVCYICFVSVSDS